MKLAIISVSKTGARLGALIKERCPGEDIHLFERHGAESGAEAAYFNRTFALTHDIFHKFDGILYIMASGIVVRAIALCLQSKVKDPAVLCMDECGKHCISLLSGHLGGANDLCRLISKAAGADPVITTATDVHGRRAPDDVARVLMMRVEPVGALKPVNSLIAENKKVLWFIDPSAEGAPSISRRLQELGVTAQSLDDIKKYHFDGAVIISEKNVQVPFPHVFLRPKNLFVGIGCRRGTSREDIQKAFDSSLSMIHGFSYQVKSLASVDRKADEPGLLAFAAQMKLPVHFYTAGQLKKICDAYQLETSPFVEKIIGVGNVCQSAALMEARQGKTALPKKKFHGITISIALGLSSSSVSGQAIRTK